MREIEELMLKECQILSPALLEFSLILFFVNKAILICVLNHNVLVISANNLLVFLSLLHGILGQYYLLWSPLANVVSVT
mgnify:CR=1 FL=1